MGRVDLVAAAAVVLTVAMAFAYLSIIDEQDGDPALWVLVVLACAATSAGYGAVRSVRHRRESLLLAGVLLVLLGLLAILTIGLPILAAGALCLWAVARVEATPVR